MAAALDAEDICTICHNERKVDPVVLECGHSYCSNCLVEFLDHCIPVGDDPESGGHPNQPAPSLTPVQSDITQPNNSPDMGPGFSCPQCRRPIVLDVLQNQTNSIDIRIDHISQNVQRQYRRRRRNVVPFSSPTSSYFSPNQLSKLRWFKLLMCIMAFIHFFSLVSDRIKNYQKCQPIEFRQLFSFFCILLAFVDHFLGMCTTWLRFHKQLCLLYRFGVLVCLVYVVWDIVQAIEGCSQPVATVPAVFVSCINGALFFLVSKIIENPSASPRQSLNQRFNQVQPSRHAPMGVQNGLVYPWRQGATSGNQEAIVTITTGPTIS